MGTRCIEEDSQIIQPGSKHALILLYIVDRDHGVGTDS